MDANNHTATLPIADYNELLAVKELFGFEKLTPENGDLYIHISRAIAESINNYNKMQGQFMNNISPDQAIKKIEIYFKINT